MPDKIDIKQVLVGPFQVFAYIVSCPKTREAVIIDPGGDEERLSSLISDEDLKVKYILNTHGHMDHVAANTELKKMFDAPVCMHEADDDFFSKGDGKMSSERELGLPAPEPADIRLKHGDVLEVGEMKVKVIHTPGHTPGSVCFLVHGNLFTGDTLFVGAVGRTDLTGSSFEDLLKSIKEEIVTLPKDTKVWPGHDYGEMPSSTIAWEKDENPYISDFILA
ncbi:MBL fold metallo-hydrolase [Thermodesulfobacteriota bacterium]